MRPTIIQKDKLTIVGIAGDENDTSSVWNLAEKKYSQDPFPKADNNGYEVRFSDNCIHVGFLSEESVENFDSITLPASLYAVFDVFVAKGYDSENERINKWLADNESAFIQGVLGGNKYIIECYIDERYKSGCMPDSVVEIWVPLEETSLFCHFCNIPMTRLSDFGTEVDGSCNRNYCLYCYEKGALNNEITIDKLMDDVRILADIEDKYPNLLSTALYEYVNQWLCLNQDERILSIPTLQSKLFDGIDCNFLGTQWEQE